MEYDPEKYPHIIDYLCTLPASTQALDLINIYYGEEVAEALSNAHHLSNLQTLDLSGDFIGEEGSKVLAKATHLSGLQTLFLEYNAIRDEGAKALAKADHLSDLQTLNLVCNLIDEGGAKALAKASHLSNLQTLNLGSNYIGDEGAKALAKASHLSNLQTLNLRNNAISAEGAKALAESPHLSNLKVLDLGDNIIGNKGAKALAESCHLSNLKTLALGDSDISEEGVKVLTESPYLSNLQTLDLEFNTTGDEGAKALAQTSHLLNLQTLNLIYSGISDVGAKALAKASQLSRLQSLNLQGNAIFDDGAKALAKARHLSNLQRLNLSSTSIGDEGAKAILSHLTQLTSVGFSYCQLTAPSCLDNIEELRSYYQISEVEEKVACPVVRTILIGEPEVGKTTLYKRMVGLPVELGKEKRTHGTNRKTYDFELVRNLSGDKPIDIRIQLDLWDMGGQTLQHMCHGLFFRTNALYILVINETSTAKGIEHWLDLLKHQAQSKKRKITIIPVLNPKNGMTTKRILDTAEQLLSKYKGEACFYWVDAVDVDVSLANEEGLSKLLSALRSQLERFPLDYYWRAIDEILPHVNQWQAPCFRDSEFKRKLRELEIFSSIYQRISGAVEANGGSPPTISTFSGNVLSLLDNLGLVTEIRNPNIVITQPRWVENGLYSLLPPEDNQQEQNDVQTKFYERIRATNDDLLPGFFSLDDIKPVWEALEIPDEEHQDLLDVLTKKELGLVFSIDKTNERFFVPAYLDDLLDKSERDLALAIIKAYKTAHYCRILEAPYWPLYFIYRHMVWTVAVGKEKSIATPFLLKQNAWSKRHYWLLAKHNPHAEFEIIFHKNKLWCFGHTSGESQIDTTEDFLRLFDYLKESYYAVLHHCLDMHQVHFDQYLPCPQCMEFSIETPAVDLLANVGMIDYPLTRNNRDRDFKLNCSNTEACHLIAANAIEGYLLKRNKTDEYAEKEVLPTVSTDKSDVFEAVKCVGNYLLSKEIAKRSSTPNYNGEIEPALVQSGKPISTDTWDDWINGIVDNPTSKKLDAFVAHIIDTFPIVMEWAGSKEAKIKALEKQKQVIVLAAKNLGMP